MSDVSEESLLDYFYSTGGNSGRVKNADILKTFKPFIGHSDLQLRAKYREEFKLIIDRIAVVKSENGEKYLFLKKKYRQSLQERDTKHQGTEVDGQTHLSPNRTPSAVQWEVTDTSTSSLPQKELQDERMSCGEPESAAESEPEQDEECTGSMGSTAVALDPIEKEWIYSAAGARVPDLSQLLRQDPSLAHKKFSHCPVAMADHLLRVALSLCSPHPDKIARPPLKCREMGGTALHWAAKHGNEDMAALVANAGADVNTKSGYTPLHIAALHGHQNILDLLIGTYGAKENLRDYSGHLACHYLNIREPEGPEEDCELQFHVTQARERNRNRKLVSLFHSKKKWGSAEDLAPIEEERTAQQHQLAVPPFRPRKRNLQLRVEETSVQRANKPICNDEHTGELLRPSSGKLGRDTSCRIEGSRGPRNHRGPDTGERQQQPHQLSHRPSRPNQRRLSLTQQRAVNQHAPRRELGGGPLPGPKQRHTYICKRFQCHYYYERMIEWS
eukprot:superscaffoldBa00003429_g16926